MKSSIFKKKRYSSNKIAAVDLFCGAGGLTHGLIKQSIVVRAGFDIDPICQYAYETNNKASFKLKDVAKVTGKEVREFFKDDEVKVLAGCAPCQPFSKYTQGIDTTKDKKWPMLYEFSRIVEEILPEVVTMENVPQVIKHQVYVDFEAKLKKLGYHVTSKVVYCPDYGIPQTRQRLVLLASRLGPIELIKPTTKPDQYKTVKAAIGKLPPIKHGERDEHDPLHCASRMSDINYARIKASKPEGSWKDWDKGLVADCHRKPGRDTYRSVYGRMSWDKPSPTITTQFVGFGNGRFGHPKQNRAISLREGAILQTFPKGYEFVKPDSKIYMKHLSTMIGNAVPVKLGEVIGKSIKKHVEIINAA